MPHTYRQNTWGYWSDAQTYTNLNNITSSYIWNDVWLSNSTTAVTTYLQARSDTYTWENWNNADLFRNRYIVNDRTWSDWIDVGTGTIRTGGGVGRVAFPVRGFQPAAVPLVRTEEEWTAIREEQERQRAERDLLQAAARTEARKLLAIVLSSEQLAAYDRDKEFTVVGSHGGIFKLRHGTSGNVRQVVDGREVSVLCVHPQLHEYGEDGGVGYLPTEDSLVGQVLAIMHDEHTFVRTANVHRGQRHLSVVREAA